MRLDDDRAQTAKYLHDVGVICIAAGEVERARAALTESAHLAQDGTAVRGQLTSFAPKARSRLSKLLEK